MRLTIFKHVKHAWKDKVCRTNNLKCFHTWLQTIDPALMVKQRLVWLLNSIVAAADT